MNIDIKFSQHSTKRGLVLAIFSFLAVIEILRDNLVAATALMAIGQQTAGWLGIILDDKTNDKTS